MRNVREVAFETGPDGVSYVTHHKYYGGALVGVKDCRVCATVLGRDGSPVKHCDACGRPVMLGRQHHGAQPHPPEFVYCDDNRRGAHMTHMILCPDCAVPIDGLDIIACRACAAHHQGKEPHGTQATHCHA